MARLTTRLERLEADASCGDGSANMQVFILDEDDPLPDGVDAEADDVMVVRLVAGEREAPHV